MSSLGRVGWIVAAVDFVAVLALVIWGVSRDNAAKDLNAQLEQAHATAQADQEKAQAEIKELTDDLASANDERAALAAELAAAKQKVDNAVQPAAAPAGQDMAAAFQKLLSGKGGEPSEEGGSPMASVAKMFEGEGGEAMMDMSVQMQLNMMYGDYFSQAQLSPEKEQRAKEILAAYQKEMMRLGLDAMQGKLDPEAAKAKTDELSKALRADMSATLSPSEMPAWDQYEANKTTNMVSKGIDMQLGMMAPGLTPESREMAKQVITEELLATGNDFSSPAGQMNSQDAQLQAIQRARERLSTSLEPDQVSQLDGFIQQMESMMKMQQQMMQPKGK